MGLKYCPFCMELVEQESAICPVCGRELQKDKASLEYALPLYTVIDNKYLVGNMTEKQEKHGMIRYIAFNITSKQKVWLCEYYPENLVYREKGSSNIKIYGGQKDSYMKKYNEFVCKYKSLQRNNPEKGIQDICFANGTAYIVYIMKDTELQSLVSKGKDTIIENQRTKKTIQPASKGKSDHHPLNKKVVIKRGKYAAQFSIAGIVLAVALILYGFKVIGNDQGEQDIVKNIKAVAATGTAVSLTPIPKETTKAELNTTCVPPSQTPAGKKITPIQTPLPKKSKSISQPEQKNSGKKSKKKKIMSENTYERKTDNQPISKTKPIETEDSEERSNKKGSYEKDKSIKDSDVEGSIFNLSDDILK